MENSLTAPAFRNPRRDWLVPAGLLALSAAPTLFGVVRLFGLALGRATLPDHARLSDHPVPLVLHIVGATGFAVLGALQFSAPLQRRRFHRLAGRVAVLLGVVAALSAMWLATMVPPAADDAPWLRGPRFAAGAGTLACLLAGFTAVARRDLAAHTAWMTRAYALALGSGTQFFTLLPYVLLADRRDETVASVLLAAGWLVNLAVAERAIRRRRQCAAGPIAALALVWLVARPAHADERARLGSLLETAAESAHDARLRDGASGLSAGVLFAGAGVASWVTPSSPDARVARDAVGGALVGVGGVMLLGSAYALATPTELEHHRADYVAALCDGSADRADAALRDAERALASRARSAKAERIAEAVVSFVFGAAEIGGGLVLQAHADDDGLVWLGRGLVAGGVGAGILGVSALAVRSEDERMADAWRRERALPAPRAVTFAPRLGLGSVGLSGTF